MISAVAHAQTSPRAVKPLRWVSSAASAIGNREENQDAYWFAEPALLGEEAVFVVADGMGGGQFGAWAAQNAIHAVVNALRHSSIAPETGPLPDRLREAIARANASVHAIQTSTEAEYGAAQVGCALAAVVLRGQALTIAHVGDVRVYLWRRGELRALTRDHSWAAEFGEDTDAAHAMRHVLSRAIGPKPEVEPDISTHPVEAGDVVVLCTDGVWSALPEMEMAQMIAQTSPEALANRLVKAAQARDMSDNATALVVALGKSGRDSRGLWVAFAAIIASLTLIGLVGAWAGLFVGSRTPLSLGDAPSPSTLGSPHNEESASTVPEPSPLPTTELEANVPFPQPTATLAVLPAVKICAESDFNRSQERCAYSMTEISRRSTIYLSWEPPEAELQRAEIKRVGFALPPREVTPSQGTGYARLEARDFGSGLQLNATYALRLHFAGIAKPTEVLFKVVR